MQEIPGGTCYPGNMGGGLGRVFLLLIPCPLLYFRPHGLFYKFKRMHLHTRGIIDCYLND